MDKGERQPDSRAAGRFFRAAKCYEGQGPFVLWQITTGGAGKAFLIADATQRSFGVRLAPTRSEDLKADGAVVATLRKHARTGAIGAVARHRPTGDVWLGVWTTRGATPDLWIQLAMAAPPELRVIRADGTVLVRKSSQGTYTKRRTFEGALPPDLPADELEPLALADARGAPPLVATPRDAVGARSALAKAPADALPDFQRAARDRLARRVKTVRKAHARRDREQRQADREPALRAEAELLRDHLHLVQPGVSELEVKRGETKVALRLNPELTAGQNLEAYYERAKKARRAVRALEAHAADAARDSARLEEDLARLRAGPLAKSEVEAVLRRHHLPLDAQATRGDRGAADVPTKPYRAYLVPQGDGPPVEVRVGRSAEASDALVKAARANDYWLHAAGVTGSHVVIPAQKLRGDLTPATLRVGAILALHHSKARQDRRGEVYFTRRQHVRKRQGMAPGLWQVDKAETLFCAYEAAELETVLGLHQP